MTRLHQSREPNRYRKRGMFFDVYMGVNIPISQLFFQILHALGLLHEHQRPDRDRYIDVDMATVSAHGFDNDLKKACFQESSIITTRIEFISINI